MQRTSGRERGIYKEYLSNLIRFSVGGAHFGKFH